MMLIRFYADQIETLISPLPNTHAGSLTRGSEPRNSASLSHPGSREFDEGEVMNTSRG